jgi:hypothetical protein
VLGASSDSDVGILSGTPENYCPRETKTSPEKADNFVLITAIIFLAIISIPHLPLLPAKLFSLLF